MTPNILLFACDDLRWNALSGMGHPQVKTPHLDRLMEAGTTFSRCYIPGSLVPAVCMPSRAMLHTGRQLFNISGSGEDIPDDHASLGACLGEKGYDTFHTGKWHNGRRCFNNHFKDGEAVFFGGMDDQWNMPLNHYDKTGKYGNRLPYVLDPKHESVVRYRQCDYTSGGRHATDVFADTACEFLEGRKDGDPPFFLSVALTAPHDPRNTLEEFHSMYPAETIPLPGNFLSQHPLDTGELRVRDEMLAEIPRNPSEVRQHIADYYAMTSHLDDAFGRVHDTLEKAGLAESTLIIFTSDHGLSVGQHGLMGKQNLYDHSLRVPLVMAGPGLQKGARINELVCHFDLFQTLCELTDHETPCGLDSRSLIPVMEGKPGRNELYLAYGSTIRGLLQGHWKLIEYASPGYRGTQLFDLESDPMETFDQSRNPDQVPRLKDMRARLKELAVTCSDNGFLSL